MSFGFNKNIIKALKRKTKHPHLPRVVGRNGLTMTDTEPVFYSFDEPGYDSHADRHNKPFPSIEKRPFAYFGQLPKPPAPPKKGDLVLAKGKKGVSISAAHHQQLVLLAGLPSLAGVKLGDLLDNILTAYFEDYAPEVLRELRKLRATFPRTDLDLTTR